MASAPSYVRSEKPPHQEADAHQELLASLTRINNYNPPVQTCSTGWTFHGLHSGPTSVAYMFLRLSQLYPSLMFKGQSLLDWAQSYLDLGITGRRDPVDSSHCGVGSEILAQVAVRAVMEQDPSLARQLCSYESAVNDAGGSSEWLYGRAGYLYFLRLVRTGFDEGSKTATMIDETIQKTVQRIMSSEQPWTCRGKAYLGAAHDTLGILTQLVLASPSCAKSLEPLLSSTLDARYPSGEIPSSLPANSEVPVQFSYGSPGIVIALRSLRPHFPNLHKKIDCATQAAQQDIQKRRLLTKTPNLMDKIASNALALDDEAEFKDFLASMSSEVLEADGWIKIAGKSDQFVGLLTGEAGRAWVWAVADRGLSRRPCIGFNDL